MIIYPKYRVNGDVHWKHYMKDEPYKKWVDWICSLFPNNGNLIDIGCGDGLFSTKLAQKGLQVKGFDISEEGIKIAREKTKNIKRFKRPEFWVVEAEYLAQDYTGKEYNYCLASEVIEHMTGWEKMIEFFSFKVNDYMILTTPEKDARGKGKLGRYHVREFSQKEINGLFAGCKIERLRNNDLKDKEWNTDYYMVFKISK